MKSQGKSFEREKSSNSSRISTKEVRQYSSSLGYLTNIEQREINMMVKSAEKLSNKGAKL